MKKLIFITILFITFFFAKEVSAGVITRPSMNNGLVGYWSFDSPGDKNTNNVRDQSGKGNNGTLTNMDSASDWVDGKIGQALDFDGSNDYVNLNVANITGSSPTQETFSFWVKPKTIRSQAIFESDTVLRGSSPSRYFVMQISGTLAVLPCNVAYSAGTPTALTVNNWYNVMWVRNGSSNKIYINGIQEVDSTITATCAMTANNTIGTGYHDYFNGLIDEVRIYNRALSASEVQRLYKLTKPKIGIAGKTTTINASTKGKLTNGLVGHWTFDGPDMAGVTAYDRSGQGNNGTLTNGPSRVIGRLGQALSFNNLANSYVDLGNVSSLNFTTGNFSISAWVKTSDSSGTIDGIVAKTLRYQLYMNNIKAEFALYDGTNNPFTTGTSNINNGVWRHIVAVRNSGKIILYVDGVQENSANDTTGNLSSNDSVYIGTRRTTPDEYWHGSIDEVRVYNRTLSADEIKRLYNMGR